MLLHRLLTFAADAERDPRADDCGAITGRGETAICAVVVVDVVGLVGVEIVVWLVIEGITEDAT